MVPTAVPTAFLVHGCPAVLEIGFDSTLATASGDVLRLPVTLAPGVDTRQTLEFAFTVRYDPALLTFLHIENEATIAAGLKIFVTEQPGIVVITSEAGMPLMAGGVLLQLFFQAMETKDAMPVSIWIEDVSVVQSTGGSAVFHCEPQVTLYGERVFVDGICRPLLRLRPGVVLAQNAPNPFTAAQGQTRIGYRVTGTAPVRLEILDQFGRVVSVLAEGEKPAGSYEAIWTPPSSTPSGVYHCVLREGETVKTRNIVFAR